MTHRTLADLTPRDRSILRLCRDESLRLPEIAERLGLTRNQLYMQVRKFRKWGFGIPARQSGAVPKKKVRCPTPAAPHAPVNYEAEMRDKCGEGDALFALALRNTGRVKVRK